MAYLRSLGSRIITLTLLLGCGDGDATGAGAGDATSTSSQTSATSGSSSSISGSTSNTSTSGSTSTTSATSSSSSGTPGCDDDGDGVDKAGPGCCGAPDDCDCDDLNDDVFPGQSDYFTEPNPNADPMSPTAFDYNCNGAQDKQYPQDTDGCGLLNCAAAEAFTGDNGEYFCGAPGVFITCNGLTCTVEGNIDLGCN